jgi:hypothetical protein
MFCSNKESFNFLDFLADYAFCNVINVLVYPDMKLQIQCYKDWFRAIGRKHDSVKQWRTKKNIRDNFGFIIANVLSHYL